MLNRIIKSSFKPSHFLPQTATLNCSSGLHRTSLRYFSKSIWKGPHDTYPHPENLQDLSKDEFDQYHQRLLKDTIKQAYPHLEIPSAQEIPFEENFEIWNATAADQSLIRYYWIFIAGLTSVSLFLCLRWQNFYRNAVSRVKADFEGVDDNELKSLVVLSCEDGDKGTDQVDQYFNFKRKHNFDFKDNSDFLVGFATVRFSFKPK